MSIRIAMMALGCTLALAATASSATATYQEIWHAPNFQGNLTVGSQPEMIEDNGHLVEVMPAANGLDAHYYFISGKDLKQDLARKDPAIAGKINPNDACKICMNNVYVRDGNVDGRLLAVYEKIN